VQSSEFSTPTLNPFDPGFNADPFPLYQYLREFEPVHHSPLGFWALSRYADVDLALNDSRLSSVPSKYSSHNRQHLSQSPAARLARHSLTFMDPPAHTRLRQLVGKVLTDHIARERRELIGRAVEDLITPHLERG
jgi:cytochrome P450